MHVKSLEIAFFTLLATLIPLPAYAYIDPGLGSLVFQSAVAAFVAVAGAWAAFKMKISMWFHSRKQKGDDAASR